MDKAEHQQKRRECHYFQLFYSPKHKHHACNYSKNESLPTKQGHFLIYISPNRIVANSWHRCIEPNVVSLKGFTVYGGIDEANKNQRYLF